MVDVIDFPPNLKITDRADPQMIPNTRSGGVAMDGGEQLLSSLSERWEWRIAVPILTEDAARSIRVVKSALKGKFNYLRVRMCDQYRITRKDVGSYDSGVVTFSDGVPFSDESTFALSSPTSPVMVAAEESSMTLEIHASEFGGYMTAGVFFSVNDWLYQIDNWELDGDNYVLTISPPLREAVAAGDEADFNAVAIWGLTADDVARLELLGGRFGTVDITLVEPVGRRLDAS